MKWILAILLILGISVVFLRFVVGGDEDSWICEQGQWVRHGNPSTSMPNTICR